MTSIDCESKGGPGPGLRLPGATMRALGYQVIDIITEHMSEIASLPVMGRPAAQGVARLRGERIPWAGAADPGALLREVRALLRDGNAHPDHPRFVAFVPSPGNFIGALAAALAAGFAVPTGWRFSGPAASAIESAAISWLVELLGLPAGTGGLFVSGGSTANLTALAAARDLTLGVGAGASGGTAYCSDQTHFSVDRALHVLGFEPGRLRRLPSDRAQRLDPRLLAERVADDRKAGLRPFVVVANAGATSTGAVDPLPELAALCRAEQMWLHVDGAYGAAAAATEQGRRALSGLDLADSLAVDPHKWLFQPAELGCVLLREPEGLRKAFGVELPPYLAERPEGEGPGVDFMQYGIQQTREFRALKLWLSLKVFGGRAFQDAVAHGIAAAEDLGRFIDECPGVELVTPPSLAVLTFRCAPGPGAPQPGPQASDRIVDRVCLELLEDGQALAMPTTVAGRRAFRLCTINPRADRGDLRAIVVRLRDLWRAHAAAPDGQGGP